MKDPLDRAFQGLVSFQSRRLAEQARSRGWISDAQLEEAAGAEGVEAAASVLGKWITPEQLAEIRLSLREQDAPSSPIPPPAEAAGAARNPERILDTYVLVAEIGRGAAGTVWKAWDRTLCRWVAVKTLGEGPPAEVRERFLREAQAAARLKHPNLVTVYGSGSARGRPYVVMELIEGKPLGLDGPMRDRVGRVKRIAEAVGAAHRAGVVHRDLKPGNVLVDARGEPHVVDFGLAHFSASSARMTKTGSVLGTPRYMAPEQVQGRTDIGPAADVYALGAILYEQLTGKAPHEAETLPELYSRIVAEDPVAPRRRAGDVPRDLEVVCLKALEKDPRRRYADAVALAEDLGRHLNGEPVLAKPPGALVQARRLLWRHRVALVVALAVGAASFAGLSYRRVADVQARYSTAMEAGLEKWNEVVGRIRPTGPMQVSDVSEAIAHFERAAAVRPERGDPWLWIGRCRLLAGDPEGAERAWSDGIARDPKHGPLRIERAGCYLAEYLKTRRPPVALQGKSGKPAFRPQRPETTDEAAWRKRVEADLHAPVRPGMTSAEQHMLDVVLLMTIGKYADVTDHLTLGTTTPNWDHRCLGILGVAQYGTGRLDEAVQALDQAIRLRPEPCWFVARGHVHLAKREGARAMADYDEALKRLPGDPEILAARALAMHFAGKGAEALAQLDELVSKHPADGAMYLNRGRIRAERRDLEGAERDFRDAVRLSPTWAEAYSNLGGVLLLRGQVEDALVELDTAVGLDNSFADALRNRVVARMAAGKTKEAMEDSRRLRDLHEGDHDTLYQAARLHEQLGNLSEAVDELDAALRLAPPDWAHRKEAEALKIEWSKRPK